MLDVSVIVGPTAAGKTWLALELAGGRPDIEIVSADSRQVYVGMDIGTAKPTPQERESVPHHMLDLITPDESYSAGIYAESARAVITEILARGRTPLVVGGSGFYIRALFSGLSAPPVDQEVLRELTRRGEVEGYDVLYRELLAIDPVAAGAQSSRNRVKVLRALACWVQTGRPYSSYTSESSIDPSGFRPRYLGVAPSRELLYRRIEDRVMTMLDEGLLLETGKLLDAGYDRDSPGLRTVGYSEACAYLAADITRDEMVAAIKQATRRYAKRQMTWFGRLEGVAWMDKPDHEEARGLLGL